MHPIYLFVGALATAYLLPGADMILLLQTSAREGRPAAMATAVGLGAARATHVFLAGVGLAALLKTSAVAFDAVRCLGAAYLVWLGLGVIRGGPELATAGGGRAKPSGAGKAALRGFMTNIANPKALVFCSLLLPQFLSSAYDVAAQFAWLGAILVAVGLAFDTLYVLAGDAIGLLFRRSAATRAVQRWLFGGVLIGFGARLAFTARAG